MNKVKLADRIWLRMNRKPQGNKITYAAITLPWLFIGITMAFAVIALTGTIVANTPIIFPVVLWAYTIGLAIYIVQADRKKGYIDSIQSHYLKRREEKLAKIHGDGQQNKMEVS